MEGFWPKLIDYYDYMIVRNGPVMYESSWSVKDGSEKVRDKETGNC